MVNEAIVGMICKERSAAVGIHGGTADIWIVFGHRPAYTNLH